MTEDLGSLARREFFRRAGGLALLPFFGHSPMAHAQDLNVRVGISYDEHQHLYGLKGIDFQAGYGVPITALNDSWVYDTGKNGDGKRADGGTSVWLEDDFGFRTVLAGLSKVIAQTGQRVGNLTIIGEEGNNALRGVQYGNSVRLTNDAPVHTHISRCYPKFAERFIQFRFASIDPITKERRLVGNPDEQSANKSSLLTSVYQGDNSANERLLEKANKKFDEIADRNPDSFLAWYIRNSPDIRFFPRTLVADRLIENDLHNLVGTPHLKEDVLRYLEWHSKAYETEPGAGLFLPYVNSAIKERYHIAKNEPGRIDQLVQKSNEIVLLYRQKKWREMIQATKDYQQMAPVGNLSKGMNEFSNELNLGVGYMNIREYDKAMVHVLTALGLSTNLSLKYKEHNLRKIYTILWNLNTIAGNKELAEFFKTSYHNVAAAIIKDK